MQGYNTAAGDGGINYPLKGMFECMCAGYSRVCRGNGSTAQAGTFLYSRSLKP